jgi:hypothetical protein
MKTIITFLFSFAAVVCYAQQKLLTQAIITTKTTIVAPEGEEDNVQSSQGPDGQQMRVVRFGGDGETKTTTWLKNDLVKTLSESEMGRTTVIRDNSKKLTTTIMEMMGRKNGFYATDEDQELMRKRMDSMMSTRNSNSNANIDRTPATFSIVYVDESKKVSGYDCKKAFVISTRGTRKPDTTVVWYCPDMKLQGLVSTGGMMAGLGGFASAALGSNGMENLNGFPMQYERTMNRGRTMTVQVTKLVIDKEVTDKEFEIPKEIEVKAMKDMQTGGMPGTFQIRSGGGG